MHKLTVAVLFSLSLASGVCSAPAQSSGQLARRGLLSWPGRFFGSSRWGLVLGPAPLIEVGHENGSPAAASGAFPAANPAAGPVTFSTEFSTRTVLTIPASAASTPVASKATSSPPAAASAASSNVAVVAPHASSSKPVATPKPTVQSSTARPAAHSSPAAQPRPTQPAPAPAPSPSHSAQPAPAPAPSPSAAPNPPPQTSNSGSGSSADQAAYLKAHNDERAKHGARPLTWNNNLQAKAQQWANHCVFQHSQGTLGPFGENLAAGTGSFSIAQAIGAWNAESSQYNPSDPQASHFTQVVWKATTEVGCALATCNGIFPSGPAQFYVCEYSPQGNVIGEITQNVQP